MMRILRFSVHCSTTETRRKCSTSNYSSNFVRQQFQDFFIQKKNHKFVKSSSVIPFCDPSLSFTNAGMNQFKNILMGKQEPVFKRVVNSQKCIRVGGKHNDLSIVGTDSYHHTFFEMLGNWSFGDYFKREACEMAWELLTKVFKIPHERFYVTYFHGDSKLGLPADLECKEIWLKLGLPEDRILGFGLKENFWEMGSSGPCGGCSEIHIDHLPSYRHLNRRCDVNNDKSDLTEIWNIVFVEHFRDTENNISNLSRKHIDTGMGLERMVAFLQGKSSNYDTDLFVPILKEIERSTGAPKYSRSFEGSNCAIDTAYRIIADHSRMVAISLADGIFPEQNQKLRRIIRKCVNISEKEFQTPNLLINTMPIVSEILGGTFTELNDKLPLVLDLVKYEQELYRSLRSIMSKDVARIVQNNPKLNGLELFDYPGFIKGYEELQRFKKGTDTLSGEFMYYIHSSFGFDIEFIEKLAEFENLSIDKSSFKNIMQEVRKTSSGNLMCSASTLSLNNSIIENTDNTVKYSYKYNEKAQMYVSTPVKAKILKIIDETVGSIQSTDEGKNKNIKLIFDVSPFYYESGGQEADKGTIRHENNEFTLNSVFRLKDSVLHEISIENLANTIKVNDEVELLPDYHRRSALIRNHSATHLLNSALRKVLKMPIYQKSSLVTENNLKIEFACFGSKLNHDITKQIEEIVRTVILEKPLKNVTRIINSQTLESENDVLMVPGEVYPSEGIRVITFGDNFSKELCCGTHVSSTHEILEFTFLSMRSTGRNSYLFSATTGEKARNAIKLGDSLLEELNSLNKEITSQNFNDILIRVREISGKLNSNSQVAFVKKLECNEIIADIKEKAKHESREILSELLDIEMKDLLERTAELPYLIHFLECSDLMKSVSLLKATRYVRDRPVMIFSVSDDSTIKARCCVPSKLATETFNAEKWLKEASKIVKSQISPPKDQNPWEVSNMKERKIKPEALDNILNDAISSADNFAKKFFKLHLKEAKSY